MVLPGTLSSALLLIVFSIICFGLWPNLLKATGKWRFELFSFDFAVGALLLALIAAYTLGTLGSDLNFSDSMLVAGRRAELMAVMAGAVFALGNMLYLATIALMGLSNGTLLTFSAFGCGVSLLHFSSKHYLLAVFGFVILASAALYAATSAKLKREAAAKVQKSTTGSGPGSFSANTKGTITGVLGGLTLAGFVPVLGIAQTDELGIGAYGGLLLAVIGMAIGTLFLNFFFLNISLEGGAIGYSSYFSGTIKNHIVGGLAGALWAAGSLALYTAFTGTVGITASHALLAPFLGALISIICGFVIWQKTPQSGSAKRNSLMAVVLFIGGAAVLLAGFR